jgi:hypothetical protein
LALAFESLQNHAWCLSYIPDYQHAKICSGNLKGICCQFLEMS